MGVGFTILPNGAVGLTIWMFAVNSVVSNFSFWLAFRLQRGFQSQLEIQRLNSFVKTSICINLYQIK